MGFFRNRRPAPETNGQGQANTRSTTDTDQPNGLPNGNEPPTRAGTSPGPNAAVADFPPKASWDDIWRYFITLGNWKYLLGTAGSWFLVDFAFFGLGMNSPQLISRVWYNGSPFTNANSPQDWNSEINQKPDPYTVFRDNAHHFLVIVSIGAVLGSLVLIREVNHVSRKTLQWGGFLGLSALFFVIGAIFSSSASASNSHVVVAVFYGLCQFLFNLGPNGLTFMFPAEIFPTRYRCSCHGISAAAGKLGSVIVQVALSKIQFGRRSLDNPEPHQLGHVLLAFGAVMLLGALVSYFFLPEVQYKKDHESISLEDMAKRFEKPVHILFSEDIEMQTGLAGFAGRHLRRRKVVTEGEGEV